MPVGSTHAHINRAGGFRPSATVCAQMPTQGRNPPHTGFLATAPSQIVL
ncbi:hypothetical protein [Kamptonema formosum]|nr:hypothetical protein [Oscillatoria sp. PCC 10802]